MKKGTMLFTVFIAISSVAHACGKERWPVKVLTDMRLFFEGVCTLASRAADNVAVRIRRERKAVPS
jgi:CRISPR/Cas system-associated protein Csm6